MNFLKNITEKAKSIADSPVRSLGRGSDDYYDGEENNIPVGAASSEQEGFICPLCFGSFSHQQGLETHFLTSHAEGEIDIAQQSPNIEQRFGSLDLHKSHNGNGNGHTDNGDNVDSSGKGTARMVSPAPEDILSNQVEALEEAKQLLTKEVMTLRQRITQLESDHVPGGAVLDRANHLAAENVALKASVDELSSDKASLEERLQAMELEKAGRDSKDDSSVLKQELINVQRAMDEAMKVKESEMAELKKSYDEIFYEKQTLVDTVSSKDQEISSLRQELAAGAEGGQKLSKENNSALTKMKEEMVPLKISLTEKDSMIKERDGKILNLSRTLEQKITLLEDKLETEKKIRSEITELKAEIKEKGEEQDTSLKTIDALQKERDEILLKAEKLKTDVEEIRESLTYERTSKESVSLELSNLKTSCLRLESTITEKDQQIVNLNGSNEQKLAEITRLGNEREELLGKIEAGEGVNEAIQQLQAENSSLQEKLSNEASEYSTREDELRQKIKDSETKYDSLQSSLSSLQQDHDGKIREIGDQLKAIQELSDERDELQEKLRSSKQTIESLHVNHRNEVSKLESSHGEALLALTNDIQEKEQIYQRIKIKYDSAEENVLSLEDKVKELENKYLTTQEEKDNLLQDRNKLEDSILTERQNSEKIQSALNMANDREQEMETKIRSLEQKSVQDAENLRLLKKAKSLVQEEKVSVERSLDEKTSKCQDLEVVIEANKFKINELEKVLTETEKKVTEMREAIEESVGKEQNLKSQVEEQNKTIFAIEEEKASIVISFESQQTILDRLTAEKDAAETELRKSKAESEGLEEKICQLQTQIEKESIKNAEELNELRTAKDLLLSQIVDLKNDKESLAANIVIEREQSQARVAALEIKLQDSKLNMEKVSQDLEREKTEHLATEDRNKKQITVLEQGKKETSEQLADSLSQLEKLRSQFAETEKERDMALSRSLELEAGVSSAAEERRGLLERCVGAEAETERTRNMTVELRRKLDDAHAALHELGRENQSIQVELVKQSGRKWKDDAEVNNCTACSNNFSLTNRKHHCRNCGDIFCNDCSSKQAIMDGYRKPQRVCDACFSELGSK